MNTHRELPDPMLRLLDEELAPSTRDAAIDSLLTDREALARMKLALSFAADTEQFVRSARSLPVRGAWFRRWQIWFGPAVAAAAIYATVGGLSRPDAHEARMADAMAPGTTQLAGIDDRISGGTFEQPADIFRQSFD